jgi:hypothetical protein
MNIQFFFLPKIVISQVCCIYRPKIVIGFFHSQFITNTQFVVIQFKSKFLSLPLNKKR